MSKSAKSHTSDRVVCHDLSHAIHQPSFQPVAAQGSPRSSANSITTTTPTDVSTAQTSSQTSLSGSSTAFLASRSEIRFALETNFALQSALLSIEPAGAAAAPQQPTATTPAHNVHFSNLSLNPARFFFCCDNDDDDAEISRNPQFSPNIHFASDPNECYRLREREIQLPPRPDRCEDDGSSIPLRGQYVDVFNDDNDAGPLLLLEDDGDLDNDPPSPPPPPLQPRLCWYDDDDDDDNDDEGDLLLLEDEDDGDLDNDPPPPPPLQPRLCWYDDDDDNDDDGDLLLLEDDDDGDLDNAPPPPFLPRLAPPPPGLDCGYDDDDLATSVRKFAWSYARGLSALVMGGFAKGSTHGAGAGAVGRSVLVGGK